MPFTKSAVESFICSRAAAVKRCGPSDLMGRVPQSKSWLSEFGLAVIFNDFPPSELRPLVIDFIRRVSAAYLEYHLARQNVLELIKDGYGRWSPYFRALTYFEVAIAQLYLALNSIRTHSQHDFFKTGDGSFEESLNLIYNASKHDLAGAELPLWFTDEGIASKNAMLTFAEIEVFMEKMAEVVAGLCNREIALQAFKS